ncbi:formylglycine-generating enzyme family protein [Treponema sp. R6D11]
MKKTVKLFGVAVIIAVIVFLALPLTGCEEDDDDDGGGGGGSSGLNIEMVSIPAGSFTMGSPGNEPGRGSFETQHEVTLSAFKMAKYEVTQALWVAVMGAGEDRTTATPGKGDNLPVYNVGLYDAIVFCNKLSIMEGLNPVYSIGDSTNPSAWGDIPTYRTDAWDTAVMDKTKNGYRLPTEAEWEYACRAETTTAFNTGATITDDTGWYRDNSESKVHEVGLKPANAWGLHDMHGNVWERCWDFNKNDLTIPAGRYDNDPCVDGPILADYSRITRGGCWDSATSAELRSARRNSYFPTIRNTTIGFRLARSN